MSKTQELKKLLRTLNSIYEAACASEDVQLTEIEIVNHWSEGEFPDDKFNGYIKKKLLSQDIVIKYTLTRPQYERP